MRKSFRIATFGCKVNQYESQVIREALLRYGWEETLHNPDYFIINTCMVTSRTERKIRKLLSYIKSNFSSQIIFCGCLVEGNKAANFSGVDMFLGNQDKYSIVNILGLDGKCREEISFFKGHTRAFVKIQDGCNNFCSYCIIPYLRGRSRSRPREDILKEARNLENNGYKEIVLTGICLGDYGKDFSNSYRLSDLVSDLINNIKGVRIRLSSLEPGDVTEGLISLMARNPRVCPHLHLPFQSGDDGVLKYMNRPYTANDYLTLIERLRKQVDNITITTDIIVGFPGESDESFKNTVSFLKKLSPLKVHIFPFSPRPYTTAVRLGGRVPSHIVKYRREELKDLCSTLSYRERRKFLGKSLEAIGESGGVCLTANYIKVSLEKGVQKGALFPVKITEVSDRETRGIKEE